MYLQVNTSQKLSFYWNSTAYGLTNRQSEDGFVYQAIMSLILHI